MCTVVPGPDSGKHGPDYTDEQCNVGKAPEVSQAVAIFVKFHGSRLSQRASKWEKFVIQVTAQSAGERRPRRDVLHGQFALLRNLFA